MKLSKVFIAIAACYIMLLSFYGCSETVNAENNADKFAVNEYGQTYGTIPDPNSVSDVLPMDVGEYYKTYYPDLISVYATNGKEGYVYREEFCFVPSNPEEAVKYSQSKKEPLTVYESDGRTVVGVFEQN